MEVHLQALALAKLIGQLRIDHSLDHRIFELRQALHAVVQLNQLIPQGFKMFLDQGNQIGELQAHLGCTTQDNGFR